jgi:hypothetical protein
MPNVSFAVRLQQQHDFTCVHSQDSAGMLWPEFVVAGTQELLGWCCGGALACSSYCQVLE